MFSRNYVHRSNVLGAGLIAFIAGAAVATLLGKKMKDKGRDWSKFSDLKDEINDQASKITGLTQEKYYEIVDSTAAKYATARGISQNELRDLVDDLKWHWRRIKSSWNNNRYSDSM